MIEYSIFRSTDLVFNFSRLSTLGEQPNSTKRALVKQNNTAFQQKWQRLHYDSVGDRAFAICVLQH